MRKLLFGVLWIAATLFAAYAAHAVEITAPQQVKAGAGASLSTSGSGDGKLIVIGPAGVVKRDVTLGETINLDPEEVRSAGRYTAIVRQGGESKAATFYVTAAEPGKINFLARPSRVPVSRAGVISGVAFVFDEYRNLVMQPTPVKFNLSVGGNTVNRTETSRNGIAWTRLDSASREGAAQFVVSAGNASEKRVVQQVASEACDIHMTAQPSKRGILVQTTPVRDCSGNPLPDGTIVTFTKMDDKGKTTVGARIKRGFAQAELPDSPSARIYVASGVVLGNQIEWRGARQPDRMAGCAMKRSMIRGAVLIFGLWLFISGAASLVLRAAEDTPKFAVNTSAAGPRQIEEGTAKAIQRDYSDAWKTLARASGENRAELLDMAFVGTARDKLRDRIAGQKQAGLTVRLIDRGHEVDAVFYSPEGSSIQLEDVASFDLEVLDGNDVIHREQVKQKYIVVLSAAENRWKVRVMEEVL
jgi:hypothetical protein